MLCCMFYVYEHMIFLRTYDTSYKVEDNFFVWGMSFFSDLILPATNDLICEIKLASKFCVM